jgi:thiol-disulfide isomerase/thioredoxin
MFLFLFPSGTGSVHFGPNVMELSNLTAVEARNTTVWIVMFHGTHCPACQMTYPEFIAGADHAFGLVKFGQVDTGVNPDLGARFQVRSIPHFVIFHPGGQMVYQGGRTSRAFLNGASRLIPNFVRPVNDSWLNSTTKAVILFRDNSSVPPIFAALSCAFRNESYEFGLAPNTSLHNQSLYVAFGVTSLPSILMINGSVKMFYTGKPAFTPLRVAIAAFFQGLLKPPRPKVTEPNITQLVSKSEFDKVCSHQGTFCVLLGGETADPIYKTMAIKYRSDPFKFYLCGEACPLKYAREGVWIFHHNKPAAVRLPESKDMNVALDRVIDGGLVFQKLSQLTGSEGL